jgi:hypothetical protein
MELGTQVELRDACQSVVAQGGKITFYINCRIFNTGSDYRARIVEPAACRDRDGNLYREVYGTQEFAVMCPDSSTWRRITGDFAYWLIDVYGATGVYLDQIGSAPACPCYATDHGHDAPGTFNQGYLKLLEDVHRRVKTRLPDAFLMIENCGDAYGQYVDAHLTWMPNADAGKRDRYWAVFKYTFPECVQVNMVDPLGPLLAQRRRARAAGSPPPEPEGDVLLATLGGRSPEAYACWVMNRAILIGSAFWLHAEAEDLPPEMQAAVRFRRAINHVVAYGRFRDTVGLTFGPAVEATRFDLDGGADGAGPAGRERTVLVLAWNTGDEEQRVQVDLGGYAPRRVRRFLLDAEPGGWMPLAAPAGVAAAGGSLDVHVPAAQLCAVEITCTSVSPRSVSDPWP